MFPPTCLTNPYFEMNYHPTHLPTTYLPTYLFPIFLLFTYALPTYLPIHNDCPYVFTYFKFLIK
jgi:hypothetical protein